MDEPKYLVAVVGAGPAGLYASRKLAEGGARVMLLNRDIKPGGLAEYGIYWDKYKMRQGLHNQFKQILAEPLIDYYGNVTVCSGGSIVLEDLLDIGFQAVLVTTGAQGTKWLRLPGENLPGVYHAKNIVFHYNLLPPFSEKKYLLGKRVAVVGAGNVMMDISHHLIRDCKVEEVISVVRRGPAEVKFTRKEMEGVAANLDLPRLDAEFARVTPIMQAAGQDPQAAKGAITVAIPNALAAVSNTRFRFEFLATPVRIMGDWMNGVTGLKVEENALLNVEGNIKARGTGNTHVIEADTVIFAIGDTVDKDFCVPIFNDAYMTDQTPRFPVDHLSYEAFNPDTNQRIERVFLAGWARQASTGLVGYARRDGENASKSILAYLQTQPVLNNLNEIATQFEHRLRETHLQVVDKIHLTWLEEIERIEAQKNSLEEFKFPTNKEMFTAMGI
jgi:ferredoxin/flavodoxin---NADP+ reductase